MPIEVDSLTYILIQATGFITLCKISNLLGKQLQKIENPFKRNNNVTIRQYATWAKYYRYAWDTGLVNKRTGELK